MTAPINSGIISGFPPSNFFGGAVPTARVTSNASAFFVIDQYIVPEGVSRIIGECWGSGQGATAPAGADDADIGASSGYAMASFAVNPGDLVNMVLGAQGFGGGIDGEDTYIEHNGVVVAKAAGGATGTAQVGDLVLVGAGGASTIDLTLQPHVIKPGAPRGAGSGYVVASGTSEAGSFPGGGGYAVNGSTQASGGAACVILWIPNPVHFV